MFTPVELMLQRTRKFGTDSDASFFTELLYAGEFFVKITTSALVSSIQDDRDNHRYRILHGLIRADGIGEWASKLDEALTGPASQHLTERAKELRRTFTERLGKESWQYAAVRELREVLCGVNPSAQPIGDKVSLREWFSTFAEVRNKTRGHGAITPAACARLVPKLDSSINLVCQNNPIFLLSWAYIHRNLSGKYRVITLGGDDSVFSSLKSSAAVSGHNYQNGVYIEIGGLRHVEFIHTDLDVSDFFLPNGAFNGRSYELHSLISDNRLEGDASPYLAIAGNRPPSETDGSLNLDVVGNVFSNLPATIAGYVGRPHLEFEVKNALMNDRHPIVTLVGRGGIGKTSLALKVLHELAETDRYAVILWFSARDIDLLTEGPKVVQPQILTERDIADQFKSLLGIVDDNIEVRKTTTALMAEHLRKSTFGSILYVFDNFETVRSPVDLFRWIDANIRLPNKAVITSRFRDFKADYPIQISGMEEAEAVELISETATRLGIRDKISQPYMRQIVDESDGHPYIIKIILGEIANETAIKKPKSILSRKDDILDALFERTFSALSPMASRIFLILSGWRSLVPQIALEAVLLRHSTDFGDPEGGVLELLRMSLIERTTAPDNSDFLSVPLTAAIFGQKKLLVSPARTVIENDIRILQDIGQTSPTGLKDGIHPRIDTFFRKMARRISDRNGSLDEIRPMLEFVARNHAPAWLLLADLEQESSTGENMDNEAEYVRRFLEQKPEAKASQLAWRRLVRLYLASNNIIAATGAFVRAAEISVPHLDQISNIANELNKARDLIDTMEVEERGTILRPLARLMELHLSDASATDLSRLAWLHLHAGNDKRASEVANLGLRRDPDNAFCQRLADRLAGGR